VAARNLQELIDGTDSVVDMLRNMQTGPNVYPVTAEFTNWRDEQWAWQNTCILFDLSYHMVDLRLEGPGALDVLKLVGFNSFDGFDVNKAKQLAPAPPRVM
jgi:glycine cleavage system aminomethyltransferase T